MKRLTDSAFPLIDSCSAIAKETYASDAMLNPQRLIAFLPISERALPTGCGGVATGSFQVLQPRSDPAESLRSVPEPLDEAAQRPANSSDISLVKSKSGTALP